MKPVLTVGEMQAVDAEALLTVPESVLVERAGTAVATAALGLMGGAYGRRVVVLAGPGNNGADGIVAARLLRGRGALVQVRRADRASSDVLRGDGINLVIDAMFGTGFRGSYVAPQVWEGTPVLAVDIQSGVKGDT